MPMYIYIYIKLFIEYDQVFSYVESYVEKREFRYSNSSSGGSSKCHFIEHVLRYENESIKKSVLNIFFNGVKNKQKY